MERVPLDVALDAFGLHSTQIAPGYDCPRCGTSSPAWAMSAPPGLGAEIDDIYCTNCAIDLERVAQAVLDQAERARLAVEEPWNTDLGVETRMERNRRIDAARWAVDPLTSPLSTECQSKWLSYIHCLNRISVDHETPASVVWPSPPSIEYPE